MDDAEVVPPEIPENDASLPPARRPPRWAPPAIGAVAGAVLFLAYRPGGIPDALVTAALFALAPALGLGLGRGVRRAMAFGVAGYAACSAGFLACRGRAGAPVAPAAAPTEAPADGCMACHGGMSGFSPYHDPKTIGCASCHLGNRLARGKDAAHRGMTLTPANLSTVDATCASARCHTGYGSRLRGSLMNTMGGVVAVDRYVFGEGRDPDHPGDVALLGTSPADRHLRNLCASCHLGNDKVQPGPIGELTRGGGCSACHLDYAGGAPAEGESHGAGGTGAKVPSRHPGISLRVSPGACFGCHSRSERISTNYEGWKETLLDPADLRAGPDRPAPRKPTPGNYRVLADGRVFEKAAPDVHFEKGMACIDCHVAAEIMGDGVRHAHEEDAVRISCADCHPRGKPPTATLARLEPETRTIAALRGLAKPGRRYLLTASGRSAYPNALLGADGKVVVSTKNGGDILHPKPQAAACGRGIAGHARLECRACHSAWESQCIDCHTAWNPSAEGWDNLAGKPVAGAWVESAGRFLADPPVLGVVRRAVAGGPAEERVATFAPGMILTLVRRGRSEMHRLYAPVSPHTTAAEGRSCLSCHANPLALGYGRGKLTYDIRTGRGVWTFVPAFGRDRRDGLPEDAWIGFLSEPSRNASTRGGARPFTLKEQQDILLVGACLRCHGEKEPKVAAVFSDFGSYRGRIGPRCVLPAWTAGPVRPRP